MKRGYTMHYIISSIILLWILYKVNKTLNQRENKPVYISGKDYKKQQAEIEKAEKQKEKEIQQAKKQKEKEIQQAEKERQQAEKNRQRKEQAEADIIFLESQLTQLNDMLYQADKELSEIERQIKIDYAMRSYAKAAKREKQKPQIVKRIMTLESRVHAAEMRLAKARYIKQAI